MTTHELLVRARAVQAEQGHAKVVVADEQERVCMQGALGLATGEWKNFPSPLSFPLSMRCLNGPLTSAVTAMGFRDVSAMCQWNNREERTLDEVLARFDQAIEATRPVEAEPVPALV